MTNKDREVVGCRNVTSLLKFKLQFLGCSTVHAQVEAILATLKEQFCQFYILSYDLME